ncbi:ribulose-phosphate 3-epimerase [Salibacterium aidingense]|uniref:ribulose-phosphate 3-epimerase n=1 Tax=Salibacterium aidingense TaxID=384933 RepID=UPI003BD8A9B9
MTYKIAPSILNADFSNLQREVETAQQGGADCLHLDVIDGVFAPSISFGPPVIASIRKHSQLWFDVHVMITNPEKYIPDFVRAGADSITIHAEGNHHLHRLIHQVKEHHIKVGVALNPATPLSQLEHVIPDLDMVLLMTVNPGFGGQTFLENVLPKIKALREFLTKNNVSLDIEVDGGITPVEAKRCADAGANIFVVGSYIYKHAKAKSKADAMQQIKKALHG